ncbi:MAG: DUF1573 domain-containing protein [Planctomycetota bacterium]|nr:DUF1573 domain-containing protein [Planctomycetota bacterium]
MAPTPNTQHKQHCPQKDASVLTFFTVLVLSTAAIIPVGSPAIQTLYAIPDDQTNSAHCVFEKSSFNFGAVLQGQSVERVFKFQNKGHKTLIITRVKSSCGCTFPALNSRVYKPGQHGEIKVTFDSKSRVGPQNKIITIESNDPKQPRITLTLYGTIIVPPRPVIDIQPDSVSLGQIQRHSKQELSFLLSNTGQKRLKIKVLQKDPGISLSPEGPWDLPSGATLIQRASLKVAKNQSGLVKRFIYFSSNDPENTIKPLEIKAYIPPSTSPKVHLSQYQFDFGWIKDPKKSPQRTVRIFNDGPSVLTINSITSSNPNISYQLSSKIIQSHQAAKLTITLKNPPPGLFQETLTIKTNSSTRPSIPIPLSAFTGPISPTKTAVLNSSINQSLTHDLGGMKAREKLKLTVAIRNNSKDSIQWPRLAPSLGPLRARRLESQPIYKPGQTVHYVLEGQAPESFGPFEWTMSWPVKDSKQGLTVNGYVIDQGQAKINLSHKNWDLGLLSCEKKIRRSILVTNSGQKDLKLESVSLVLTGDNHCLRLIDAPHGTLPPGQSKTITLEYQGRAALGLVEAILTIKSNDPKRRRIRIPISGWVGPDKDDQRLQLIYNSDEAGAIEPCGCGGKEQLGGLPRLASALKSLRQKNNLPPPMRLTLSAGDIAGGPQELDKRRAKAAFQSLGHLEYQAFVPGELDLDLGLKTLQKLAEQAKMTLVCANMTVDPKLHKAPLPYMIQSFKRGLKVAVVGLINRDLITRKEAGVHFLDPKESLKKVMPELKAKSDVIVILAHMGQRFAVQLCAEVPGADVVIVGHATEVMTQARVIEGTHFVANPDQGKRLSTLDLVIKNKNVIGHHGATHPLDQSHTNDPKIDAFLIEYRKGLRNLPPKAVKADPKAQKYVGDKVCGSCHPKERKLWKSTSHSKAMLSLEAKFNDFDPKCTSCHTVGQGKPHGYTRRDLTPKLDEVQCESCHGPGAKHSEAPKEIGVPGGTPMATIGLKSCRACHNGLHSPQFEPKSYWKRVAHGELSLRKLWDTDKDGTLSARETESLLRFQKIEGQKEELRRQRYRSAEKSKKDQR